jgi:ABC-type antimicrobial peptide transport system ATPase subunit
MAVVGPSGAGKSSFLRLLNRLDEPTGGTVLLNSEDYRGIAPRTLRRRVGMVMQTAYLFPGNRDFSGDGLQPAPTALGAGLGNLRPKRSIIGRDGGRSVALMPSAPG